MSELDSVPATKADVDAVARQLADLTDTVEAFMWKVVGFKQPVRDEIVEHIRHQRNTERYFKEPFLEAIVGHQSAVALRGGEWTSAEEPAERGYWTLEEVAAAGRDTIKRIKGVGPVAMKKLDAALPKHGFSWGGGES